MLYIPGSCTACKRTSSSSASKAAPVKSFLRRGGHDMEAQLRAKWTRASFTSGRMSCNGMMACIRAQQTTRERTARLCFRGWRIARAYLSCLNKTLANVNVCIETYHNVAYHTAGWCFMFYSMYLNLELMKSKIDD